MVWAFIFALAALACLVSGFLFGGTNTFLAGGILATLAVMATVAHWAELIWKAIRANAPKA